MSGVRYKTNFKPRLDHRKQNNMKTILAFIILVSGRFYPKFENSIVEYQPDFTIQHKTLQSRMKKSDFALDQYDHEKVSQLLDEFFTEEGYDQVSIRSKTSIINPDSFQWQDEDRYDPTDNILLQLGVN